MGTTAVRQPGSAAVPAPDSPPGPGFLSWERYALGVVGLIGFAIGTCMAGLGDGPALGDRERIVAQSARQCVESGGWLVPGLGRVPQIREAPLGVWLAGASSYVFDGPVQRPVSAYSARMPSALAGVVNTALVCWLGTMLYGRRSGLVAGFIAAGCLATVLYARNAAVEMLVTMLTTLSFALFWRAFMSNSPSRVHAIGFYVAFAAAMMAQMRLPLAIIGLPLAVFWFVSLPALRAVEGRRRGSRTDVRALAGQFRTEFGRQLQGLRALHLLPGLVLFVVLVGAWPAYLVSSVDGALELWRAGFTERYVGDLLRNPRYHGVALIFLLTVPYLLSVPEAVAAAFLSRYRGCRPQLLFVLTWAAVATVFIGCSADSRPHDLASVIPAYCLLLAPVIDRLFFGRLIIGALGARHTCRLVGVLLIVGAASGGLIVDCYWSALLPLYAVIAVIGTGLLVAATWSFAAGRRLFAYALLNLAILVVVMLGWPAAGTLFPEPAGSREFAGRLNANDIAPDVPAWSLYHRPAVAPNCARSAAPSVASADWR